MRASVQLECHARANLGPTWAGSVGDMCLPLPLLSEALIHLGSKPILRQWFIVHLFLLTVIPVVNLWFFQS